MQNISTKILCDIFICDIETLKLDLAYLSAFESSLKIEIIVDAIKFTINQDFELEIKKQLLSCIINVCSLQDCTPENLILFFSTTDLLLNNLKKHLDLQEVQNNLQLLINISIPAYLKQNSFYELLQFIFTKQELYIKYRKDILKMIDILK